MKSEHITGLAVVAVLVFAAAYLADSGDLSDIIDGLTGSSDDPVTGDSMQFSQNGQSILEKLETFQPTAYWDVNGYAIGYGSHVMPDGSPVQAGDTISQSDAAALLQSTTAGIVSWIESNVTVPLNQDQLDALVLWVYNVGEGNAGGSTLLSDLNAGNYAAADLEFGRWVWGTIGGVKQVLQALVSRETITAGLFSGGGS